MLRARGAAGALLSLVLLTVLSSCGGTAEPAPSDKPPTLAEYRKAVEAGAACVEDAGFQTTEIREGADGVTLEFNIIASSDEISGVATACYEKHTLAVERAYFWSNIPTGAERDRLHGKLLECIEAAGVSGVSRADSEQALVKAMADQLGDNMTEALLCIDQFRTVFPEGMYPE